MCTLLQCFTGSVVWWEAEKKTNETESRGEGVEEEREWMNICCNDFRFRGWASSRFRRRRCRVRVCFFSDECIHREIARWRWKLPTKLSVYWVLNAHFYNAQLWTATMRYSTRPVKWKSIEFHFKEVFILRFHSSMLSQQEPSRRWKIITTVMIHIKSSSKSIKKQHRERRMRMRRATIWI